MSDPFNKKDALGSLTIIILSILSIFTSGIYFGITYYVMDSVESSLQLMDCDIADNVYFETCQDMFSLSIYPFLALRELLVWASFFFIFALVMGMLMLGYRSGKSPALMGLLIIFVISLSYLAIELSNAFRTMLENQMFRDIMIEFTVYNKVMLNFPWFVFIVSLFSVMLSIVNWQRGRVNAPTADFDY